MFASDFQLKLKKLNRKLRIFCGDNPNLPASIWMYLPDGEESTICGVDKQQMPEFSIFDEKGHMVKSGWRRTIQLLINKKLVDRRRAERLFYTHFNHVPQVAPVIKSKIDIAIEDMNERKDYKGVPRTDDVVDIGRMIQNESEG